MADALWITDVDEVEIRPTPFAIEEDDLVVRTRFSGISRGTERIILAGRVPASEYATMRAPFQEGEFTFPVKYGYAAVGDVETGSHAGQTVFCLFPHQTRFAVPPDMAIPVPNIVPAERAVLAANMETALNIVWDARVSAGDRVAVIGAGVVGALTGYLCARFPGVEVTLVDLDPSRLDLAVTLGCVFAEPQNLMDSFDCVINTSASKVGLQTAITHAGLETRIVEASWYGERQASVLLGGAFHQKRLQIISSQVGRVPSTHAARWTYRRRLETAMEFLADPVLDSLISGETAFDSVADVYTDILVATDTLCHRIVY